MKIFAALVGFLILLLVVVPVAIEVFLIVRWIARRIGDYMAS
jgi:hypothetical protein